MSKSIRKMFTACLALCSAACSLTLTSCSGKEENKTSEKITLTLDNIAPGVFTQHIGYEDLVNKVVGSYSIAARADYWWQDNTLILTNNKNENRIGKNLPLYKDTSTTCRYELFKQMYIANRGFIFYQAYFGTFALDEENQTVQLNIPEYGYSYVWSGDNLPTNPKGESYSTGLLGTEGVKGDPSVGFNYNFYNTAKATNPEFVRINLSDNTYTNVSVFEADDQ